MNLNLLNQLIEKNIIRTDTEIEAYYGARDLSGAVLSLTRGSFYVADIEKVEEGFVFRAASTVDGKMRRIHSNHLIKIDGMTPERLGEVYSLNAKGEAVKQGKRRGRKPRVKTAEAV
jgi:hypothetical protein